MAVDRPHDMHRAFEKAFNAGDLDALVELYEPKATVLPAPGQEVTGHDAIRAALEGFLGLRGRMTMTTTLVVQAGDLALARGHWRVEGTGPDGKPVVLESDSAEVMRRQPGGGWKFAIDHPFGAAQA